MTVDLRDATEADVHQIWTFIRELAVFEKLESAHTGDEATLKETLFGAERFAKVVIASVDGADVGMALYFFNYSTFLARPGLYLEDLYVTPSARRHGVGKALLRHLARIAESKKSE